MPLAALKQTWLADWVTDVPKFTLDGKIVEVKTLQEDAEVFASRIPKWQNGAYKEGIKVYGIVRRWILNCFEKDAAWENSVVKHFVTISQNDASVPFVSTFADKPIDTTVRIFNVDFDVQKTGSGLIRRYTLSLQEVLA